MASKPILTQNCTNYFKHSNYITDVLASLTVGPSVNKYLVIELSILLAPTVLVSLCRMYIVESQAP